jgi:hypothetical protein
MTESSKQKLWWFAGLFVRLLLVLLLGFISVFLLAGIFMALRFDARVLRGLLILGMFVGYLLIHGTNAVGVAFLTADEKTGKSLKCVELAGTGFSNGRLEALLIAEQLPQVKKQDYELRSLDMPWLLFSAVWLHGKSNDIIVPLPDHWKRWNRDQPYSEGEIIKILKPEAQRKLKFPPGMVD